MTKFKLSIITLVMMMASSSVFAQIWNVGFGNMTFTDATRGNRAIEVNLFYPADVSGWNVPLGSPVTQRYPVIVFGHDEATSFSNYQYTWNYWTRKGFIVAMVLTEMAVPMDVLEYAKDLAFVATRFQVMRFDNTSFFFNRYNSKSCIMGHGKGASAALIAAQYHPGLTTLITLAANETFPSAIAAASLVTVPSVVVAAGQDCVSPVGTVQEAIFNNLNTNCKTFMNYTASPRCHFAQDAGNCTNSQINCGGPTPYSWQATNSGLTWTLVSFMRYYMKSNAPALAKFEWKLQQKQNDFVYVFSCSQSMVAIENYRSAESDNDELMNVNIYPNPVLSGTDLTLSIQAEYESKATIVITNMMGQLVARQEVEFDGVFNEFTFPTLHLRKGNYLVSVHGNEGRTTKPLIIN